MAGNSAQRKNARYALTEDLPDNANLAYFIIGPRLVTSVSVESPPGGNHRR